MTSETEKIRSNVLKYCVGKGIDIGCGDDLVVPEAVGVDDQRKGRSWVKIVADASKRLPFLDEGFDYIFSSHCLEDIENTEETLREWIRPLKRGGYIILYLPHRDLYHGVNPEHKNEFENQDIEEYLKKLDVEIVESYIHEGTYSFLVVGKRNEN